MGSPVVFRTTPLQCARDDTGPARQTLLHRHYITGRILYHRSLRRSASGRQAPGSGQVHAQHGEDENGDVAERTVAHAERVRQRADAQRLHPEPAGRVPGRAQHERPLAAEGEPPGRPDHPEAQGDLPHRLVQEGGLEGGVVLVAGYPVLGRDPHRPPPRRRRAVELLRPPVTQARDGQAERQRGRDRAATSRMTPGRAAVWTPERRYLRLATATATMIPAITHSA